VAAVASGAVEAGERYAGLVTRAIAFAIDAAIVDGVAVLVGLLTALIVSVLRLPETIDKLLLVIAGTAFVLWSIGYFVAFWSRHRATA
jgi:uncharacterized RDD family membrane protein YckC